MKHELTARRLNEALQNAGITAQELSRRSGVNKASPAELAWMELKDPLCPVEKA